MANFLHMHIPKISGNIPGLLIVGRHIPIGEYISILFDVLFRKKEADR